MGVIASVSLKLGADVSAWSAGLQRASGSLDRFNGGVAAKLDMASRSVESFARGVGQVAAGLGVFDLASRGISLAAGALKGGIKGATDLNETLSKTEAIFGPAASAITEEADRMAEAFGTAKSEYITAAGNFGAVFKGVGESQESAAALGNQLAKLGMDLASFENSSDSDAFGAISSALRGEFDPIERFRVFLSADKVAAEAMALGLTKAGKAVDEQAKKQATLSLILKQTKDAHGYLAKESGSLAGQQRKLAGTIQNLGTSVGKALLPAFDRGLAAVASFSGKLQSAFEANRPRIERFAAGLGSAIDRISAAAAEFWPSVRRIGQEIASAFASVGSSLGSFLPTFDGAVAAIKGGLERAAGAVRGVVEAIRGVPILVDQAFGPGSAAMIGSVAAGIAAVSASLSALGGSLAAAVGLATAIAAPLVTIPVLAAAAGVGIAALAGNFHSLEESISDANFALQNAGGIWDWMQTNAGLNDWTNRVLPFMSDPNDGRRFNGRGELIESDAAIRAREKLAAPQIARARAQDKAGGFDPVRQATQRLEEAQAQAATFLANMAPGIVGPPDLRPDKESGDKAAAFDVEAAKELDKFAEKLKDSLKTPAEKFTEGMKKAKEAFDKGLITAQELKEAPEEIAKQAGADDFGKSFFDKLKSPQERFAESLGKLDEAMRAGQVNPGPEYRKAKLQLAKDADLIDVDKLKTPQERFAESLGKLDSAFQAGVLTPLQYQRARMQAAKENGVEDEARFAGAARLGSQEAYSAIVAGITGRGDGMKEVARSSTLTASHTGALVNLMSRWAGQQATPEVITF